MHKFLLLLAFIANTIMCSAQSDSLSKKKFHWGRSQDTTAGYTQAILVGDVLYISGTVARGNTMADQIKGVYANIERTLQHYGLSFHHVVKENLYTTDIEAVKENNDIRKAYYKTDFPAATWVQISRLYMPSTLIEVEVIAHTTLKK